MLPLSRPQGGYPALWEHFGETPFILREVIDWQGGSRARQGMLLTRLVERGWAVRLERAHYVLLRPLSPISAAATGWPKRVGSPAVRDLLRLTLSGLDGALGAELVSVALFGSYARGNPCPESDLDILVVLEEPLASEDEAQVAMKVRATYEPLLARLWETQRIHPIPALLFISKRTASRGSPFLLDLTWEAILLHDRQDTLRVALKRLATRARRMGVRRGELPGGRWYWAMPPGAPLSSLSAEA